MMNSKNRTGGIDNMREVFVLVLVSLIVLLTMPLIFTNVALANATDAGYINITAEEAKQMIDENQNIVILDVRPPAEYESGYIAGAGCTVPESAYECKCSGGSTEGKKHKRGYVKVPDGCSAPIPPPFKDNPVGLPGCSFKDACDAHDCCYGTCNSNKATCDNAFYGDMMQICTSSCLYAVVSCTNWATIYYGAVVAFGGTAYSNNQDLACEKCWCCPEGTPNAGTEYTPQNPEDGCCAYSGGCRSGNLDPEECRICYGGTWHPGKKCCDGNCYECCTDTDCQEGYICNPETHECEEEVPEFPAGVTAVFGATFFIFFMMRRKYIEK